MYGLLYVETERAAKQLLGVGANGNARFGGGASQGIDGVRAQGEVDGGLAVILGDSAELGTGYRGVPFFRGKLCNKIMGEYQARR